MKGTAIGVKTKGTDTQTPEVQIGIREKGAIARTEKGNTIQKMAITGHHPVTKKNRDIRGKEREEMARGTGEVTDRTKQKKLHSRAG
jgi:hypothetical protein